MNLSLLADQYLAALFSQEGWEVRLNLPHWALLVVPEWADCVYIAKHYRAALTGGTVPIYVQYGGASKFVCKITKEEEYPVNIEIGAGLTANRALLDVFGEMLTSPSRSLGLVRLRDERQISVSGGAGGQFLIGKTVEQAVKQYRADYWHPADLAQFNRDWQQSLSVGGGTWFEATYRCFDPLAPAYRRGPEFCNHEFTTRYRLVEGGNGELYHYCENLGVEAIA